MTKWSSDEFLNTQRDLGDARADACFAALPPGDDLVFAFSRLRADTELPPELPAPLLAYLHAPGGHDLSDLTESDWDRLRRGQKVFLTHALPMALALLGKSLPEGYQAPRLSNVLMISGELKTSTYRRVLGVMQMLVNINEPGSFEPAPDGTQASHGFSDAAMTALGLRLMHASLRDLARRTLPDFGDRLGGVPVSLEDMLFTIIAFSLHVVQGVQLMRIPISAEDCEDYWFVWRVYARCMGIHPPDEPKSWDCIPATLGEAQEFNLAYARRHFRTAAENPDGTVLAVAQVDMIASRLVGGWLQYLVPKFVPRLYFELLIGPDACKNLGVVRARPLPGIKWIVLNVPRGWAALWRTYDRIAGNNRRHIELSRRFFQRLILWQYGGAATYRVARSAEEVEQLVSGTRPGLDYGRQQFRQSVFPTELRDLRERRTALELDASQLHGPPSTDRGLTGLALSGGGIRAAAFSLGAVQAIAKHGRLKQVDYLSTVSGGGYFGGALSSALTHPDAGLDGDAFPFGFQGGAEEPPAVRHIRNGSNYLAGDDLLSEIRLPTIMLRGLLINGVLFMPLLMLAAWLTWVLFPFATDNRIGPYIIFVAMIGFLAMMISYPMISFFGGHRFTWKRRDYYENLQAMSLLTMTIALLFALLSVPVTWAIGTNTDTALELLRTEVSNPFEAQDAWKWVLLGLTITAVLSAGKVSKTITQRASQFFVLLLGVIGPAILFGVYLLLLVLFARSPNLLVSDAATLDGMLQPHATRSASDAASRNKLYSDLRNRDIDFDTSVALMGDPGRVWKFKDVTGHEYTIKRSMNVLALSDVQFGARPADWWFVGVMALVLLLNRVWVDVNVSSAHGFYRDRLSKAFLIRTGRYGPVMANDDQKLSTLGENPAAPYHLINTSINLSGERLSDLPGRPADFFLFSKRFVGSYATGYCDTHPMEKRDTRLNLGTAMAVSGAAAAPNSGTATIRPLAFILTLLNVRLGYWVPNPWYVQAPSLVRRLRLLSRPGPFYLLREGLGLLNAKTSFVNISDGGHIENLGIYELLRRRCKVIIAIDAEWDPTLSCPSLARLTRYARTDLGLEIQIDTGCLRLNDVGNVNAHWTVGTIHYGDNEKGYLLYVKSSLTGDEAPYVLDYKRQYPAFPHESTADQFFGEMQFEAYRALGFHTTNSALTGLKSAAATPEGHGVPEDIAQLRRALGFPEAVPS